MKKQLLLLMIGLSILSLNAVQNGNNNNNNDEEKQVQEMSQKEQKQQMKEQQKQQEEQMQNEQEEKQQQEEQIKEQQKQVKKEKIEVMSPEEKKEKMIESYKVTVNNETGKDIKIELEYNPSRYPGEKYDPTLHRGERDILLYGESQPKQGQSGSTTIEHCIKKITVKVKKEGNLFEQIVVEKEVDICDEATVDINLKDGKYTINTGLLGRLFGGF